MMLKIYLIVFGAIVVAGGIQGFVVAKSNASLIAGGILGVLAIVAAVLLGTKPTAGLILGLIATGAIAGRFLPNFLKAPDKVAALWPAGILSVLGVIGVVLVVLELARSKGS